MVEKKGRNGGTLLVREKGDPSPPGSGRPVGSISHASKFKAFLSGKESYEIEIDGEKQMVEMTREEILMYRLYKIAQKGDTTKSGESSGVSVAAIKEIHDRTHGKPPQEMNVKTETPTQVFVKMPDGKIVEW